MTRFKIYIQDLAARNEGFTVGMWVELPLHEEDLRDKVQTVLKEGHNLGLQEDACCCSKHEEWFVADVEGPGMGDYYDPYMDVYKLNDMINDMQDHINRDDLAVEIIIDHYGLEEGLDILESREYIHYRDVNTADIVYEELDSMYNLPDFIKNHLDIKQLYDSLSYDYNYLWSKDDCVKILNY